MRRRPKRPVLTSKKVQLAWDLGGDGCRLSAEFGTFIVSSSGSDICALNRMAEGHGLRAYRSRKASPRNRRFAGMQSLKTPLCNNPVLTKPSITLGVPCFKEL